MKPEYIPVFFAVGIVGVVILYILLRRDEASLNKKSAVQKDNDWLYFGIAMFVLIFVMFGLLYSISSANEKDNQRPIEEKLRTEEFSYKGHQYIMFKTNRTFDGMSVVHDPNCECQLKKDSI